MQTPGSKHEKARITANFCCNVDGSHKLPPWFIGKAAKPRCFGSASINIRNFNAIWRHNKKGWMTGRIFKNYLLWFDQRMLGQKVVLLIDGFSAHYTGKLLANLIAHTDGFRPESLPRKPTSWPDQYQNHLPSCQRHLILSTARSRHH